MSLPPDFHFSQASLQDYVDCRRRFWLRCVQDVRWPAPEVRTEAGSDEELENERRARLGEAFHRLVQRHILGIPAERLAPAAAVDVDLQRWWAHYLAQGPSLRPMAVYPELTLSAPLDNYRLTATYDLLAIGEEGRAVIVDWKTSRRRPQREWLAGRLQTRIYPYLLVRAGVQLHAGRPFVPEQVEMIYWFPDFPDEPERFAYDTAQFQADEFYLASLIAEVAALEDAEFERTAHEARCRYCCYRSLCRREGTGEWSDELDLQDARDDVADERDNLFSFDQIAEIEF